MICSYFLNRENKGLEKGDGSQQKQMVVDVTRTVQEGETKTLPSRICHEVFTGFHERLVISRKSHKI